MDLHEYRLQRGSGDVLSIKKLRKKFSAITDRVPLSAPACDTAKRSSVESKEGCAGVVGSGGASNCVNSRLEWKEIHLDLSEESVAGMLALSKEASTALAFTLSFGNLQEGH